MGRDGEGLCTHTPTGTSPAACATRAKVSSMLEGPIPPKVGVGSSEVRVDSSRVGCYD